MKVLKVNQSLKISVASSVYFYFVFDLLQILCNLWFSTVFGLSGAGAAPGSVSGGGSAACYCV